jgi:predicted anti-sigma-YlaC factor YlaD
MAERCPDTELLAACIENNVTTEEQVRVDAHLAQCGDCFQVVASVLASKIALPDPTVSDPESS